MFSAVGATAAPRQYPVELLAHFKGRTYASVKEQVGPPDNEKHYDDQIMAIWYWARPGGVNAFRGKNCQFVMVVDAEQVVTDVDLSGDIGVCESMIRRRRSVWKEPKE